MSAGWLTDVLRRSGQLEAGEVQTIAAEVVRQSPRGVMCRLAVSYSAGAVTTAPARLLLKYRPRRSSPPEALARIRREVEFYQALAPDMRHLPIVRCYDAVLAEAIGAYHLLLDDLTETHEVLRDVERNAEVLARIHAHWWGDARLRAEAGPSLVDLPIERFVDLALGEPSHFAAQFAGLVPEERLHTYRRVLAFYPRLRQDRASQPATLVHGDAHCGNFLHPLAPAAGPVRLVDWEWWRVDAGTDDLAFMIHRCRRRRKGGNWERRMVSAYHRHLRTFGVGGYGLAECWRGYRESVVRTLIQEIILFTGRTTDQNRERRWNDLEKATEAFDDLGCADLL